MSITEMLQELKENNLTSIAVNENSFTEYYKGLRHNTCIITTSHDEFSNDKDLFTSLELSENNTPNEENIKYAYKHMKIQNFSLPYVI